jgi:hypothetical protein
MVRNDSKQLPGIPEDRIMKKFLIISGVGSISVVILLIVGFSNIGPLIKKAVNTMGPEITKTAVSLDDVSVSIFSGKAQIKDFVLGNPKGFKTPNAMKVGIVSVDLYEESITGNPIVINKIEISKPEITYEKKGRTDNFKVILANITKSVKAGKVVKKKTQKEKGSKPVKKILIKHVIVKDGTVNLTMDLLAGETISAPLPDIHLKDIGKGKKGATPAEAFEIIFDSLYSDINADSVTGVFNNGLKKLGVLKNINEEGGKAAEKAVETVTTALESAADNLSGFFQSD